MARPSDEFAFIDWVRKRSGTHPRVPIGIGDDAAAIRFPEPADCLVAADMLMEDVHFRLSEYSPYNVGRKALAVNLSDIAAMAGIPLAAFVTVALPRKRGREFAQQIHNGVQELAGRFNVSVAGGDTNVWDGPLIISVTVVGEAGPRGIARRSGACPGDAILVTGSLGGSIRGKHMTFEPRVVEAHRMSEAVRLHAMIDISDGLSADLHHILEESGVGAELVEQAIPISEAARTADDGKSPLDHAFGDGEDFELLLTVSPEDADRLIAQSPLSCGLTRIGEIVPGSGCVLIHSDGSRAALDPKGWSHDF